MSSILHIETAVEGASVCLADEQGLIGFAANAPTTESAAWLHVGLQQLLAGAGISVNQLAAVAISTGPGSYTGLRIGMAAAKGLCFAADLPLLTLSTLQAMASGVANPEALLLCPMIDARRMEVFTAVYHPTLTEAAPYAARVLEEGSFGELLAGHKILFFGNGSAKFRAICNHPNARFISTAFTAKDMVLLARRQFASGDFADLAYTEPFYGKEFYSPPGKKKY